MLVLSRRVGERVYIGDEGFVQIVKAGPDGVRIGFEFPPHIRIIREELRERPQADDKRSE